jgi:hypothetical protein
MLLLTDGSVLAQDAGTKFWWRLRPDRVGRYAQGQWKPTASSYSSPLYFASAVLADGRVLVAGGEYSNNGTVAADLCSAELYDPVAEAWQTLPTPEGWTAIGDAPCCVLNDGRLLLGNIDGGPCAIWDPAAKTWTSTPPKLNGSSNEETWTLLPDGSVLTVDCRNQVDASPSPSERFVNGVWAENGQVDPGLVEAASSEIGPAILLPDGTVFALGATGATGRFMPNADPTKAGVWEAGPPTPAGRGDQRLGAKDAPACLLPNGRVLCALGPVDGQAASYLGPTTFFEFDPVHNAWSAPLASPFPADANAPAPFSLAFLLLPDGAVLVSDGTATLRMFSPDGSTDDAWAPIIETCPDELEPGGDYAFDGMQLNGLSQACSYGDDAAMATNYPLVRLRASVPSDDIVYCRTHDHSSMGVATGRSVHSSRFTVPGTVAPGVWFLEVVTNGISSASRCVMVCVRSGDRAATAGPAAEITGFRSPIFAEGEIFLRDLSEVHLLLDFVSGRADKSLTDLGGLCGFDGAGEPIAMKAPAVVEEVCSISYPPKGGIEAKAQQAAFILLVKDKLNFLASPARGMTVAFTSMFAGVAVPYDPIGSFPRLFGGSGKRGRTPPSSLGEKTLQFSAAAAYPQLMDRARQFRTWYDSIPVSAGWLLLLVVLLNWDISVTTSELEAITNADANYAKVISGAKGFVPTLANCTPPPAAGSGQQIACLQANAALEATVRSRAYFKHALSGLPITPIRVSMLLLEPPSGGSAKGVAAAPIDDALEAHVRAVVAALNTIVIPALFGWLGTLAGLVRSITAKLRDSVLAPRDYQVSRTVIFLGVAAGLTVGLFFKPTVTGGAVGAAGLAFLAGFGAEAFFGFLDGLISRVFGSGAAAATTSSGSRPALRPPGP